MQIIYLHVIQTTDYIHMKHTIVKVELILWIITGKIKIPISDAIYSAFIHN